MFLLINNFYETMWTTIVNNFDCLSPNDWSGIHRWNPDSSLDDLNGAPER